MPIRGRTALTRAPSRRAFISGLVGAAALPASPSWLAAQPFSGPSSFAIGRFQFRFIQPARILPPTPLRRLDATVVDLSSLRGKPIVLNFWATWCPPCRKELPSLDRLQATMDGDKLQVAAVSVDRQGRSVVEPFVQSLKLQHLPIYLDPDGKVAYSDRENRRNAPFALYALPITYLIDRAGRIAGYLPGDADWTSAEASALLNHFIRS